MEVVTGTPAPAGAVQLGMLGREDAPLTKAETRIISDDTVMTTCCTGDHEYPEDDDPDCSCFTAACDCAVNPDNEDGTGYTCGNCEACESCCESSGNCRSCDACCETRNSYNFCEACDRCNDCCSSAGECWTCDGCDNKKSTEHSSCSNCSECEKCCSCKWCENCEEHHDEDKPWCVGGGDSCKNSCECDDCLEANESQQEMKKESEPILLVTRNTGLDPYYKPRTQKAKGYNILSKAVANRYAEHELPVPQAYICDAKLINTSALVNRFVRPCPMTPRHGFVDSRFIASIEEAEKIKAETLAADPDAEMILMAPIDAAYSAIWTPGLMVIGPGNDGATSGHGSVTIPVAGNYLAGTREDLLSLSGVKTAPYVEILWKQSRPGYAPALYNVQLRDGPKLTQQVDYIAADTVVKKIVVADGDLLEWELAMTIQPEGTVVHHPGGSLASHYSVHAVLNKIPVLVSRAPVIGEVLTMNMGEEAPKEPDIDQVRAGFFYALNADCDTNSACWMMLLGCHSTTLWLGRQDLLLGAALGFTYRLAITAGVGEWRHRPGRESKYSRERVYKNMWDRIGRARGIFSRSLRDFRRMFWPGGMGGEPWFQFTKWAAHIFDALKAGDITSALGAMNNAVHAAHNGGWGFNKFGSQMMMDQVAADPAVALRKCSPLVYQILKSDGAQPAATQWFAKNAAYNIEPKAVKWLEAALSQVTPEECNFGVYRLEGSEMHVEYSNSRNTAAIVRTTIAIPAGVIGVLLGEFEWQRSHSGSRSLDNVQHGFAPLLRTSIGGKRRWIAYGPNCRFQLDNLEMSAINNRGETNEWE